MKLTVENRSTREKTVPVPLCPPQIPHRLTRNRARASGGRPATNCLSHVTASNVTNISSREVSDSCVQLLHVISNKNIAKSVMFENADYVANKAN